MRYPALLLSAAVIVTLGAGVAARDRTISGPHVRALSQDSAIVLASAQQKSATVRDLLDKIQASDLVVYVNVAALPADSPESGLSFISTSKMARFVLVTISSRAAADRRVELLGHELQHAVEVAGQEWVADNARLKSLMTVIGWRDENKARGYETTAANNVENQVRRDVRAAGVSY